MKKIVLITFYLLAVTVVGKGQTQLWGMTTLGGTGSGGLAGGGTIFKINPDGSGFDTVFNFSNPRGWNPHGSLIQGSDGNFYSTCFEGGSHASCTIFRHNPITNTHSDMYDFDVVHGDYPQSGIVQAPDGLLYGAASEGGGGLYRGVIYNIDPITNLYTDLYEFITATGCEPYAVPIVIGGKLYGTTNSGGSHNYGVIYSYDIITDVYADLFNFDDINGNSPWGSLMKASDGKLYGMTYVGGANGAGVIFCFDITTNTFQRLYSFLPATGSSPKGALVESSDGKLYGVTPVGGTNNDGVIFSYDLISSIYTVLYNFSYSTGSQPCADLTELTSVVFYGTTFIGGASNAGTIFKYDLNTNTYSDLFNFNSTNSGKNPQCTLLAVDASSVGISNFNSFEEYFNIYPNPTSLSFTITSTEKIKEIKVYNVQGEIVTNEKAIGNSVVLDMSGVSKGIYFVEIKTEKGMVMKKVVKE